MYRRKRWIKELDKNKNMSQDTYLFPYTRRTERVNDLIKSVWDNLLNEKDKCELIMLNIKRHGQI